MAKKSFKEAQQIKRPTPEQVEPLTKGGARTDRGNDGPTKRLSLDLPARMHTRFKTACSATGRKMGSEIQDFIELRTNELEEAGIILK